MNPSRGAARPLACDDDRAHSGTYPDSLEARASLLDAIYTRTSEEDERSRTSN
jgi:hypothetical protein